MQMLESRGFQVSDAEPSQRRMTWRNALLYFFDERVGRERFLHEADGFGNGMNQIPADQNHRERRIRGAQSG